MILDNRKFLIGIGVAAILVIVILLVVLFQTDTPSNTKSNNTNQYTVDLVINQNTITGILHSEGKTTEIIETEIQNYLITSFNSTRDIFWADCFDGYSLVSSNSDSGNNIINDPSLGVGMEIF